MGIYVHKLQLDSKSASQPIFKLNKIRRTQQQPRNFPICHGGGWLRKKKEKLLKMAGTNELNLQENEDSFQWDEQSQLYYHARFEFNLHFIIIVVNLKAFNTFDKFDID